MLIESTAVEEQKRSKQSTKGEQDSLLSPLSNYARWRRRSKQRDRGSPPFRHRSAESAVLVEAPKETGCPRFLGERFKIPSIISLGLNFTQTCSELERGWRGSSTVWERNKRGTKSARRFLRLLGRVQVSIRRFW